MKNISLLAALVLFAACKEESKTREPITVNYPTTKKVDTVDFYKIFKPELTPKKMLEFGEEPEKEGEEDTKEGMLNSYNNSNYN